jgi:RNA polymerase sigma factor (sigma-70 family)
MAFFGKKCTDIEFITGIQKNAPNRRWLENKLYELYAYVIREGVWKHKLTEDECSMAYSDTILTVIENIENRKFEGLSSLKTYIYQIFTNKCVDLIRKNSTNKQQVNRGETLDTLLYVLPDDSRSIIEKLMIEYDVEVLRKRLKELGEKCRQMIEAWGEGYMDQEIAVEMGYQSAAVVKTSRLRCLEKLRELYGRGKG